MKTTDKYWHNIYAGMDDAAKRDIDEAARLATDSIKESMLIFSGDDRYEQLVAAITRYVVESRGCWTKKAAEVQP